MNFTARKLSNKYHYLKILRTYSNATETLHDPCQANWMNWAKFSSWMTEGELHMCPSRWRPSHRRQTYYGVLCGRAKRSLNLEKFPSIRQHGYFPPKPFFLTSISFRELCKVPIRMSHEIGRSYVDRICISNSICMSN